MANDSTANYPIVIRLQPEVEEALRTDAEKRGCSINLVVNEALARRYKVRVDRGRFRQRYRHGVTPVK